MIAANKVSLNATNDFKYDVLKFLVVLFAKYSLHNEIINTERIKNRPTALVLKEYQKMRLKPVMIASKVKVIVI